jgi:cytochrome c-type biogenesis protein CcmF
LFKKNQNQKEILIGENFQSRIYKYYILVFFTILIIIFAIFLPILNLFNDQIKIITIAYLGNTLIISIIVITILDIFLLIGKRINYTPLVFTSMTLSISLFLLVEYCFINDLFEFLYIWNYSEASQLLVYKIVAIWAGESGSIMTWMVFNSIVLFFYRIKNHDREDYTFILSCIIGLLVLTVFLFILSSQNPFSLQPHALYALFPNGYGLSEILKSPFMIWHPFFTFLAYAVFLVPFSIVIAEFFLKAINKIDFLNVRKEIKESNELKNSYQRTFNDFALKFGWLVLTLSIGLGAYWASIALTWGRYWGWDPVETVSLLPWLFSTAYFHTVSFRKSNKKLHKMTIVLIFLSILFSTLITRGGGLNSLHAFTGERGLVVWVIIVGAFLLILSLYIINDLLTHLLEDYKKTKLFLDYLSYLFLFFLSFVCTIGLFIPPLTLYLSEFTNINPIFVVDIYYIMGIIFPAIGLALTLIYCSLWEDFNLKSITMVLIISVGVAMIIGFFTYPVIIAILIFSFSGVAAIISIIKHLSFKKGFKHFFKINSKKFIHLGFSLILMGFLTGTLLLTDILFISGFFILVLAIIPSLFMVFFRQKKSNNSD